MNTQTEYAAIRQEELDGLRLDVHDALRPARKIANQPGEYATPEEWRIFEAAIRRADHLLAKIRDLEAEPEPAAPDSAQQGWWSPSATAENDAPAPTPDARPLDLPAHLLQGRSHNDLVALRWQHRGGGA